MGYDILSKLSDALSRLDVSRKRVRRPESPAVTQASPNMIAVALRESEERFRSVAQSAHEAIICYDSNQKIFFWNKAAQRIFGFTPEEMQGQSLGAIVPDRYKQGSEDMPAWLHASDGSSLLGKTIELYGARKEGTEVPIELSLSTWKTPSGVFHTAIIRDTTDRKITEKKMLEKTMELARLTAEREQLQLFAYVASHDLQEPLQKIIGFGDLLERHSAGMLDGRSRGYLERMKNASIRMSRLIEDLLKFSRVATQAEQHERFDFNQLLKDVMSDLEMKIQESGAQITIHPLPPVTADRVQMRQLFQNLISNAIKFRKSGEVPHVVVKTSKNGDNIEITVEDNGIGFEEKYTERIFKPFERLHARDEYEGNGVGLAICNKIVLTHGGKLSARSAPGCGATFVVSLPKVLFSQGDKNVGGIAAG